MDTFRTVPWATIFLATLNKRIAGRHSARYLKIFMTCHQYQVIFRTLRHLTPRDILGGNHPPPSTPPGSVWTPARLHRQHCLGQDQWVRWRTATGQVLLQLPGHPLHSVKNVILLTLVSRCVKDSPLQSVWQQKTKLIWIGIKLNKLLSFLV